MKSSPRPFLALVLLLAASRLMAAGPGGMNLELAPESVDDSAATLVWSKPANAAPGTVFRIFQNGLPIGETTKSVFCARGLKPQTGYEFTVRALTRSLVDLGSSDPVRVTTGRPGKVISVTDFGAKGDGTFLNTKAIQAAIQACPPGGTVAVPAGVFLTGALYLKSNMTLEVQGGGTLRGSANPDDYADDLFNRFEGWEMKTYASLLNAGAMDHTLGATTYHVRIRGAGTIEGGGGVLAKAMIAKHGMRSRGRLICLMNCSGVEIQGLVLAGSPSWTVHYVYSENITCQDLAIHSNVTNGDGMDPDSSRNCDILNCTFDTGDDCIAIKSGKNPEGNAINRPTENVKIIGCRFTRGHGISIGSEISGGVQGVLVQDCQAGRLLHGFQIKGTPERGAFVQDVAVIDCELQQITVLTKLGYNNDGAAAPHMPLFHSFLFRNIDLRRADPKNAIILEGYAESGHETQDIVFQNVTLPFDARIQLDQVKRATFEKVLMVDGHQPTYELSHSSQIVH